MKYFPMSFFFFFSAYKINTVPTHYLLKERISFFLTRFFIFLYVYCCQMRSQGLAPCYKKVVRLRELSWVQSKILFFSGFISVLIL